MKGGTGGLDTDVQWGVAGRARRRAISHVLALQLLATAASLSREAPHVGARTQVRGRV
jgi:hypothetical protein